MLVEVFAPISGAHFNPVVSLVMRVRGELPWSLLLLYVAAQLVGVVLGAWLAHAMFGVDILQLSSKVRAGTGQWFAEVVATFGLIVVILRVPSRRRTGTAHRGRRVAIIWRVDSMLDGTACAALSLLPLAAGHRCLLALHLWQASA